MGLSEGDCLFCKIAAGTIPAKKLHEDDTTVAFADINPQAPFHALVIPRRHIETLNDASPADEALLGHLFTVARKLAQDAGFAERGYRALMNCNREAGQTVWHIHLHVLAGRPMRWPPG